MLVVHFHSIPNVNALPPPAQGVPLKSIAFGSCNKEWMDTDAELWESVTKSAPSAWVWMGDAIYPSGKGNYEEQVTDRKLRYGLQEAKPGYAKLSQGTPVVSSCHHPPGAHTVQVRTEHCTERHIKFSALSTQCTSNPSALSALSSQCSVRV